MKIFIGGLLPIRQQRFRQMFPEIEFEFASDQEPRRRWVSGAKRADVVIIDQGRTNHTIINMFNSMHIDYQFADGNAAIERLIRVMTHDATVE